MTQTILVTGGSGYFGEELVKKLLDSNNRVSILDINKPSFSHQNLTFLEGDINDPNLTKKIDKGFNVIHHNVAQVPLSKNKNIFWQVNKNGTQNLLKSCLELRTKKVIYVSSSAVFGIPKTNPVLETDQPRPMEEYGKAKYAAELLCQKYTQNGGDVTIIRPRTILGHGRLGIFSILFEWIYQNRNIPVLSGGNNVYQFIHSSDLADACILASHQKGSNLYNVGTDSFGTMKSALENLIKSANSSSKIKSIPIKIAEIGMNITSALNLSPLGPYHALMYGRSMYFDITKSKNELGFNPKYSNDSMLVESYNWYIQNRTTLLNSTNHSSPHQKILKQKILSVFSKIF